MTDDITVANDVYQSRIRLRILFLANEAISLKLHLAPVEVVKSRVAHATGTGPLRVKLSLWPLITVACYVGENIRYNIGRADVP